MFGFVWFVLPKPFHFKLVFKNAFYFSIYFPDIPRDRHFISPVSHERDADENTGRIYSFIVVMFAQIISMFVIVKALNWRCGWLVYSYVFINEWLINKMVMNFTQYSLEYAYYISWYLSNLSVTFKVNRRYVYSGTYTLRHSSWLRDMTVAFPDV